MCCFVSRLIFCLEAAERSKSGRIKENRPSNRDETLSLFGTFVFIVAEVCARFLQSRPFYPLSILYNSRDGSSKEQSFFNLRVPKCLRRHLKEWNVENTRPLTFFGSFCHRCPCRSVPLFPRGTSDKMTNRTASRFCQRLSPMFLALVGKTTTPPFAKSFYERSFFSSVHSIFPAENHETSLGSNSFPLPTTPPTDKTLRITIFLNDIDCSYWWWHRCLAGRFFYSLSSVRWNSFLSVLFCPSFKFIVPYCLVLGILSDFFIVSEWPWPSWDREASMKQVLENRVWRKKT